MIHWSFLPTFPIILEINVWATWIIERQVIYFLGRWDTRDPFYGVNCSKYIYNNKSLNEENKPLMFIQ